MPTTFQLQSSRSSVSLIFILAALDAPLHTIRYPWPAVDLPAAARLTATVCLPASIRLPITVRLPPSVASRPHTSPHRLPNIRMLTFIRRRQARPHRASSSLILINPFAVIHSHSSLAVVISSTSFVFGLRGSWFEGCVWTTVWPGPSGGCCVQPAIWHSVRRIRRIEWSLCEG